MLDFALTSKQFSDKLHNDLRCFANDRQITRKDYEYVLTSMKEDDEYIAVTLKKTYDGALTKYHIDISPDTPSNQRRIQKVFKEIIDNKGMIEIRDNKKIYFSITYISYKRAEPTYWKHLTTYFGGYFS